MSKLDDILMDFPHDELFVSNGKVIDEYKNPFKSLFLEIIGEDEHFEGNHKEKSYDTYLNTYKAELRKQVEKL